MLNQNPSVKPKKERTQIKRERPKSLAPSVGPQKASRRPMAAAVLLIAAALLDLRGGERAPLGGGGQWAGRAHLKHSERASAPRCMTKKRAGGGRARDEHPFLVGRRHHEAAGDGCVARIDACRSCTSGVIKFTAMAGAT